MLVGVRGDSVLSTTGDKSEELFTIVFIIRYYPFIPAGVSLLSALTGPRS